MSTSFDVCEVLHSFSMTLKLVRIARLKKFAKDRQIEGPVQLGQAIGRKTNQASDLLAGRASFGEKVARSIEEFAQLPPGWLDEDEDGAVGRAVAKREAAQAVVSESAVQVPMLSVSASMGPGIDQVHEEVVVGRLTLSPQWIDRTLAPPTNPANLRFIHGYGDSMEPTFIDGDVLLVDSGVQAIRVDGIYVLEANERLYIKRVRQRMDGGFEISSDNSTVKTVDVLDGRNTVKVLGRVVWVWNGRRL